MDHSADRPTTNTGRTLEYEMGLVREAIAMVAGGGSPRVVVAGLHFGEALLTPTRAFATVAGVRIVPLWMPDDAGADIAVERIPDEDE
jgi:hypothetical protein